MARTEPTWAERARTLLHLGGEAVLATLDADLRPLVAPVPSVADGAGCPIVVLSNLDPLTTRAWQDPRAAVAAPAEVHTTLAAMAQGARTYDAS